MSEPLTHLDLPPDAAVAIVDGSFGKAGAAAGMVLLHAGRVRLAGVPLPSVEEAWFAEAEGVALALRTALELGVGHLRLLVDLHDVAMLVQGWRPETPGERHAYLAGRLDAAREAGLSLSARVVQGHAETLDLPSRLNDVAHILGDLGTAGGYEADLPMEPDWLERLVAEDRRFKPTRTHHRWTAFLPRRRTAHFLGVDPETVDSLVRWGHLDLASDGVTRRSAAAVYVVAQGMRHDDYFGFGRSEGEPGRCEDEIYRGWDGRPSQWYHRKSGLRPTEEAGQVSRGEAGLPAHAS